jgi:hypothetical protein
MMPARTLKVYFSHSLTVSYEILVNDVRTIEKVQYSTKSALWYDTVAYAKTQNTILLCI